MRSLVGFAGRNESLHTKAAEKHTGVLLFPPPVYKVSNEHRQWLGDYPRPAWTFECFELCSHFAHVAVELGWMSPEPPRGWMARNSKRPGWTSNPPSACPDLPLVSFRKSLPPNLPSALLDYTHFVRLRDRVDHHVEQVE